MRGRRRIIALLGLSALAFWARGPKIDTGDAELDQIVNLVVAREGLFNRCAEIEGVVPLYFHTQGDNAAPSHGHVGDYHSDKVNEAAAKIAVSFAEAMDAKGRDETRFVFGEPYQSNDPEWPQTWCGMSVSTPQFSGDYAFVSYSTSHVYGRYAFRKIGARWHVEERIEAGWI